MGKIENNVTKRRKRGRWTKAIISAVGTAGILSVALFAPKSLRIFESFGISRNKKRKKELINRARNRLLKNGMLARDESGYLVLTASGESEFHKLRYEGYKLKKPKRWDRKWRVLVFDIPEHRRNQRDKIRITLKSVGFMRLQDSVWIYPYDCEDFLALLKADFRIGKDILYLVVEEMEDEQRVRRHFGLVS